MADGIHSLSGDSLFQGLNDQFKTFPDSRDPTRSIIPIEDFSMAGLAIFALKFPSLLQYDEEMRGASCVANLKPVFRLTYPPSDTHFRTIVDKFSPELYRPCFKSIFQKAQRAKVLEKFEIFNNTYCLALDGTGYYYSDHINCPNCLIKKYKGTDEKSYYHSMLCGAIVHPNMSTVIPVFPEAIQKQDGVSKNDCEQNAAKRFLVKFREDHPKLKVIILTDALTATQPMLDLYKKLQFGFVVGVKPGSHEKLFAGADQREGANQVQHFEEEFEIGEKIKKRVTRHYRFTNGLLLNHQSTSTSVNFLEFWETIQWVNKDGELKEEKVHFSWVTDYSLYKSSCITLAATGRTRWKIENETFNTLKNQGYEFEHNFGHGNANLSTNMAMLMMLAFLCDQIQEMQCPLFKAAIEKVFFRKSRIWRKLRSIFEHFPIQFNSWSELLSFFVDPKPWFRAPDSA